MQEFVEFECPLLLLIVDKSLRAILGHTQSNRLSVLVNVNVFAGKVGSRTGPDHNFD